MLQKQSIQAKQSHEHSQSIANKNSTATTSKINQNQYDTAQLIRASGPLKRKTKQERSSVDEEDSQSSTSQCSKRSRSNTAKTVEVTKNVVDKENEKHDETICIEDDDEGDLSESSTGAVINHKIRKRKGLSALDLLDEMEKKKAKQRDDSSNEFDALMSSSFYNSGQVNERASFSYRKYFKGDKKY